MGTIDKYFPPTAEKEHVYGYLSLVAEKAPQSTKEPVGCPLGEGEPRSEAAVGADDGEEYTL